MKKKVILLIVLSLLLVAMCVFVFYMETAGAADETLPNETVQAEGDNTEAAVDLTDVPTEIPETERATTPFEGDEYTAPPMTFPPEEETVPPVTEAEQDEETKAPESGSNNSGSNSGTTQKPEATEAPETEGSDPTEETGVYDEDELPPIDF